MTTRALLLIVAGLLPVALPFQAAAHPGVEHAVAAINRAIAERPADQELYIQRGAAYSNDGQLELALADFRKAETLGEPFLVAFQQGVLHYRLGERLGRRPGDANVEERAKEFRAARTYFDTFLSHFPGHFPALEQRARLLRDAGEYEAALADFNAYFAMQRRPNPGHYTSAAKMLAGIEGEGIDSALAMLDQGMQKLGIIPQLQQYAIELERSRKNWRPAIDRLESLEPALGESPDWNVEIGELLLLAGRPAEARLHFDEAAAQLATLRRTVARQRVLQKLQELQASLSETS